MEAKAKVPEWWTYPSSEHKEFMDRKYLPDYKYCMFCAKGSPQVNHEIEECPDNFDPWFEMPYESLSEARRKKEAREKIEREMQGFIFPLSVTPTPPPSPIQGVKPFFSRASAEIWLRKLPLLQEELKKKPDDQYRCSYCPSDTHTLNNCWHSNPWASPQWFLKMWINFASPRLRDPSRATKQMWGKGPWDKIIHREVRYPFHCFDYLCAVYNKKQDLAEENACFYESSSFQSATDSEICTHEIPVTKKAKRFLK